MNEEQIQVFLEELNKREATLADLRYKLLNAERALKHCGEICTSYETYGYRNEANDIRYITIKEIIRRYFDGDYIKEKEDNNDTDTPVQSESD